LLCSLCCVSGRSILHLLLLLWVLLGLRLLLLLLVLPERA
jgi:hypothetical protein